MQVACPHGCINWSASAFIYCEKHRGRVGQVFVSAGQHCFQQQRLCDKWSQSGAWWPPNWCTGDTFLLFSPPFPGLAVLSHTVSSQNVLQGASICPKPQAVGSSIREKWGALPAHAWFTTLLRGRVPTALPEMPSLPRFLWRLVTF